MKARAYAPYSDYSPQCIVVKSNSWILISKPSISVKLPVLFSLLWRIWMVKIRPWCLRFLTSICTCAGAALLWSEQLVPCCCLKPCPQSRSSISKHSSLRVCCRERLFGIFTRVGCDRARRNGFELRENRCRLDIRKEFQVLKCFLT